jgi:hypothetical protein
MVQTSVQWGGFGMEMVLVDCVKRYFEAWNNQDETALQYVFIEGGTYQDSTTNGTLTAEAIGAY